MVRHWVAVVVLLFGLVGTAQACVPAPPGSYISNMAAMYHGRAIAVSTDRDAATLEVFAYVGPGESARTVQMPALRERLSDCDFLAGVFEQGQEYLVLVEKAPSGRAVVPAEGRVVLGLDRGLFLMDFHEGRKEPVESVLADFARTKGLQVKEPVATSAVPVVWVAVGAVLVGAVGVIVWWRMRRTR